MVKNGKPQPAVQASSVEEQICIRGARVHNLRNLDLDIPRDQLVVITGPSGSGKSSLAFDTLFAEGQRQYIESLSVYARQFLHQLERPDVDLIEGLQPTISIDQRSGSQNPRSTVATVTEIYDYLRLLYARAGSTTCYQCGQPISQQTPEQIQETLLASDEGTKAIILAPLVRGRKGMHGEVFTAIRKAGFVRCRVDGKVYPIESIPQLEPRRSHTIEAVIDRIVIRPGIDARLADSIGLALRHGEGLMMVAAQSPEQAALKQEKNWRDEVFSTQYACPDCKISFEEIEPRTFSFNSPYGACPTCDGLGWRDQFDPELMIPDLELSLAEGAIQPWTQLPAAARRRQEAALGVFLERHQIGRDAPLSQLSEKLRGQLFEGEGKHYAGVLIELEKFYATCTRATTRAKLDPYRGQVVCSDCRGARLRPEARSCRIGELAIHELTALTVSAARQFLESLDFSAEQTQIAEPIVSEILKRLTFLEKVGVQYLSLARPADTLSGGELQRVRLATGIGSGLVGVCYVLDEPSIGLHPRDNQRLIDALRELQQLGNTVLVVEHDEAMMRASDCLIDMGPGAGRHGGQVVAMGPPEAVSQSAESITGKYLTGAQQIAVPARRRRTAKSRSLVLEGASINNLQNVDVQIPLGALVCVTGVSGSGKSSLITKTLAPALARRQKSVGPKPGPYKSLRGTGQISRLVEIDQSPIGRTPRSNPATYTGVFDAIRKVFAGTKQARGRGYKVGRFSFNVKGGRCEACQGQGLRKIEMNFLPDLFVQCEECEGARFNRQTLQVRYRDRSIAEVLDMRIEDSLEFFENFPLIHRGLESLYDVGLGYLALGQPSTTLSGGEAQRVKLATELARVDSGGTLYILDEPTTGLHFDDVKRLLDVLNRLVDQGNSVLVIEHNLDVIKSADWMIDLGPEGGSAGGQVVATGTPEQVAQLEENQTGRFLQPYLDC